MNIRNVLVTGASGKIGRKLIPLLLDEGYSVRAVQFHTPVVIEGVETVSGSVSDSAFVRNCLEDMDAVCHLATCKEDRENFLDVSIKGTFNLLDQSRNCGHIKRFVISGGDAALGIFYYPNPEPLDEETPLRAYPGYYAFSKVMEETMCNQYYIQYGLPVTVLRFSWIWDEDDALAYMTLKGPNFGGPVWKEIADTSKQLAFFEKNLDGVGCLRHNDGSPFVRHVVGIDDVVASFISVLGNSAADGETFNIAAPEPMVYDKFSAYLSGKLDLPILDFELDSFHDFSIDISKAQRVLGFIPKDDLYTLADKAIAFREAGRTRSEIRYFG
jgi:UDP-glucose 4-epimerase